MAKEFFKKKRPWSVYKDLILGQYLDPYLAKVAKLNRPILVVDGFAGRGQFDDGEAGSPLIIARAVEIARTRGANVRSEFVEDDTENFQALLQSTSPYQHFATCYPGKFQDHLQRFEAAAEKYTVFLYVDPYSVRGIEFDGMSRVYAKIVEAGTSVELLLNLNVAIFMRWGLAALGRVRDIPSDENFEFQADDPADRPEIATLNAIAGGTYWIDIASSDSESFIARLDSFTRCYCEQLGDYFDYVCQFPVKEKFRHDVPKYVLIHASRHPDGNDLMNEAMCKARNEFATDQLSDRPLLSPQLAAEVFAPDDGKPLENHILNILRTNGPLTRKELRLQCLRTGYFGCEQKQIHAAVKRLVDSGKIHASPNKPRLSETSILTHSLTVNE